MTQAPPLMKRILNDVMLVRWVCCLTLWAIALPAMAQENEVIDEIVAIVDGEIILRSEVNALVLNLNQQQKVPITEALWGQVLNELIDQKVMLVQAEADTTVTVSEDQVNQELDTRIARLSQQVGGEQKLEEVYGKPVLQIKDELRDNIREQLLTTTFERMKFQNVRVTPSEVRTWFHQFPTDSLPTIPEIVRVAHIVRRPAIDPAAKQEAMDLITTIRDSVVNTTAIIEDLAKFSDDPGSAQNGGRYQNMKLSEVVPEFGAVASTLEPNEISQVFETSFGLHFMRLNSRIGDVIDFNHILIRIDDSRVNAEPAIEYLNTLRDSILVHKVPFEQLAKRHSEDPFSASIGGAVMDPRSQERDLVLDALGPLWKQTISQMEVGDISEPADTELLDSRKALHIVRLQKHVPEHTVSLETDYERIEQLATQEKRTRLRRAWLDRLRASAYIRYLTDDAPESATQL